MADAIRGEDLDQVGACFLLLPHVCANVIWRAAQLSLPLERLDRRQDAGPGSTPLAMASRKGTSVGEPTLCTVVKPAISVTQAFEAA